MEELTISLALDGDGRTKFSTEEATPTGGQAEAKATKRARKEEAAIDYSTRTSQTNIDALSDEVLDSVLFDAEICDCALLPRTFWVNAGDEPRCALEKLALRVFDEHVPPGYAIDKDNSGVEWWVQIRPSPPGEFVLFGFTEYRHRHLIICRRIKLAAIQCWVVERTKATKLPRAA